MTPIILLGLLAASCTTLAFIPQVLHILHTGNTAGISLQMYSIFTTGVALWLSYGLLLQDIPIIAANLITLILALTVLPLTLKQRLQNKS